MLRISIVRRRRPIRQGPSFQLPILVSEGLVFHPGQLVVVCVVEGAVCVLQGEMEGFYA